MIDLIIYHRNCSDGFCAAYVAKNKYPKAKLLGVTYGEPMPNVGGQNILVVDFSWKKDDCITLANNAESLLILDHHKTAQEELKELPFAIFDLERSGAGLAWDYLFKSPRPWYVNYIEDRDLWKWNLPNSKEISAFITSLPMSLEAWKVLETMKVEDALADGRAILRYIEDNYVPKIVEQRQIGFYRGYKIAVVNAAYPNISEVANKLCEYADIGLGYFERKDKLFQFSLRSINEDIDVSDIAKEFPGGGGHKHAAGFELHYSKGRELIDSILGRSYINAIN